MTNAELLEQLRRIEDRVVRVKDDDLKTRLDAVDARLTQIELWVRHIAERLGLGEP
jgi:hypothetical protein